VGVLCATHDVPVGATVRASDMALSARRCPSTGTGELVVTIDKGQPDQARTQVVLPYARVFRRDGWSSP